MEKKKKKDSKDEEEDENEEDKKKKKNLKDGEEDENEEEKKKKKNLKDEEEDENEEDKKKKKKISKEDDNEDKDKEEKKIKEEEDDKKGDKDELKNKTKNSHIFRSEAILYGFEKYNFDEDNNKISFNVLFVPVYRKIVATKLKLNLKIKYKFSLRILQEKKEIECKKGDYINKQVKFECAFSPEKKEIENIEVDEENFEFVGQEVNIKACTPKAVKDMKNIKHIVNKEISDKKLYILESAEKNKGEKSINIIGKINDKSFKSEKAILTILSSDKNYEIKINCDIIPKRSKYNLFCIPTEDIEGELDGATGKLDDENLVINFKKVKDSLIKFIKI